MKSICDIIKGPRGNNIFFERGEHELQYISK